MNRFLHHSHQRILRTISWKICDWHLWRTIWIWSLIQFLRYFSIFKTDVLLGDTTVCKQTNNTTRLYKTVQQPPEGTSSVLNSNTYYVTFYPLTLHSPHYRIQALVPPVSLHCTADILRHLTSSPLPQPQIQDIKYFVPLPSWQSFLYFH